MSIRWMSEIWENGPQETTRRFILLSLADNADDNGECYPSIAVISRKCCVKERMVQYHLKALEESGFVSITRGQGRGNRSRYYLRRPWLEKVQPTAPITEEKVQPTAPIDELGKVQPTAPITGEKVQFTTIKGATHCTPLINHQEPSVKNKPSLSLIQPLVVAPPPCEGESPALTSQERVTNLVNCIVLAAPYAQSRQWAVNRVTDAHRKIVLTAAQNDAEFAGMSTGEALERMLALVEHHTAAIGDDGVRFAGNIQTYFENGNYHAPAANFTGANNGKSKAERTEDAVRSAITATVRGNSYQDPIDTGYRRLGTTPSRRPALPATVEAGRR